MSELRLYADDGSHQHTLKNFADIQQTLANVGIQFEQWQANAELPDDAESEAVQAAYAEAIEVLNRRFGFRSIDVVSMHPQHPDKTEFRGKFLDEHTHDDFEIRFFVDGEGLFYLRIDNTVYGVLCTKGDLISVPPGTTHWFDMGPNPSFTAIRFFTTEDGWVGKFTGSDVVKQFPLLDN